MLSRILQTIECGSDLERDGKPLRTEGAKAFMCKNLFAVVNYCEDKNTRRRSAMIEYMGVQNPKGQLRQVSL